jgi:hypothetical protein
VLRHGVLPIVSRKSAGMPSRPGAFVRASTCPAHILACGESCYCFVGGVAPTCYCIVGFWSIGVQNHEHGANGVPLDAPIARRAAPRYTVTVNG